MRPTNWMLALCLPLCACQSAPDRPTKAWSPATASIVFSRKAETSLDIFRRDLATGAEQNLTASDARENWPMVSPDGEWLVYQRWQERNIDLWLMRRDGSDARPLVTGEGADYLPAWSPDSQQIVFTSWRQEAGDAAPAPHLYRVNRNGSGLQRLLAESLGGSNGASYAPDGAVLVYSKQTAGESNNLFLLDLQTLQSTALTHESGYAGSPVFSPDGQRIAFYLDDGQGAVIATMQRDGSNRRLWPAPGKNWYPDWSPDGNWLLVTRQPEGSEDLNLIALPLHEQSAELPVLASPARETEGRWWPQ